MSLVFFVYSSVNSEILLIVDIFNVIFVFSSSLKQTILSTWRNHVNWTHVQKQTVENSGKPAVKTV